MINSPVNIRRLTDLQRRLIAMMGLIAVLAVPWVVVAPIYATLLARITGFLLPTDTGVGSSETVIIFVNTASQTLGQFREGLDGLVLLGGLVLLTPLVILTPGMSWSRRFDGLMAVFGLTLLANVALLVVFGWTFHWSLTASGPLTLDTVTPYNALVYIALPTLLAGAWAWRFWLPYYLRPSI